MKIGYPCINLTLDCRGDKTFRLKSYSEDRLKDTIDNNLRCLLRILEFNVEHTILFFRITSDLIPFASHPICHFSWQRYFKEGFRKIGDFIKRHDIRISMHPDQFTLINSPDNKVFERSLKELLYHTQVLDLMELDSTAKIQVHIGGVYGDKEKSIERFIRRYNGIDEVITRRLVIENDDRLYPLKDCLNLSASTGIPVVFDFFHHTINNHGESVRDAFKLFTNTWRTVDGIPMIDYSHQNPGLRRGRHADSINLPLFKRFLQHTKPFDCDIMFEIKDKEKSVLKAQKIVVNDKRFIK